MTKDKYTQTHRITREQARDEQLNLIRDNKGSRTECKAQETRGDLD